MDFQLLLIHSCEIFYVRRMGYTSVLACFVKFSYKIRQKYLTCWKIINGHIKRSCHINKVSRQQYYTVTPTPLKNCSPISPPYPLINITSMTRHHIYFPPTPSPTRQNSLSGYLLDSTSPLLSETYSPPLPFFQTNKHLLNVYLLQEPVL